MKNFRALFFRAIWVYLLFLNSCSEADKNLCVSMQPVYAGTDIISCSSSTVTLKASPLLNGNSGTWTVIEGNMGHFEHSNQPVTSFTGNFGQSYIIRWTVVNNCGEETYDDLLIYFDDQLTLLSAGVDTTIFSQSSVGLQGVSFEDGEGIWTIEDGAGGNFVDSSDPNTIFTGELETTYNLRWTYSIGECSAFDEVTIRFESQSTTLPGDYSQNRLKRVYNSSTGQLVYEFFYTNSLLTRQNITSPSGSVFYFEYEYDNNGLLKKIIYKDGRVQYFVYSNNILERKEFYNSNGILTKTWFFSYLNGKISSYIEDWPNPIFSDYIVFFTYGPNNELLRHTEENLNYPGVEIKSIEYTYYDQQGPMPLIDPSSSEQYSNMLTESISFSSTPQNDCVFTYQFDSFGKVVTKNHNFPLSPNSNYSFSYEYENIN